MTMKIKFKKPIVTAWVAGLTILVCGAVNASDIELYKPAQTSKTTLMFMLDVSGSMANENRLTNLKAGMKDLLNGNPAKNIQKLDDDLYVGLAVFSGTASNGDGTGRIQLGAKRLGETYKFDQEQDQQKFKVVETRSRLCFFVCSPWSAWEIKNGDKQM